MSAAFGSGTVSRASEMKNIRFIALKDAVHQLRRGSTLMWLFVMPPIFFFFIGTVTGGHASRMSADAAPLVV